MRDDMRDLGQNLTARLAARQSRHSAHPDANLLLAFAEHRLSDEEHADVLEHLGDCSECRQVLALAAGSKIVRPVSVWSRRGRWAAAAAVVCVVGASTWQAFRLLPHREKHPVYLASVKPPEPPRDALWPNPLPSARPSQMANRKTVEQPSSSRARAFVLPQPPPAASESELAAAQSYASGALPLRQDFVAAKVENEPTTVSKNQTLWSLDSPFKQNGVLRKSDDGGRTWRAVPVDGKTRLTALTAQGSDVWAGGERGALFQSTDGGAHWRPVSLPSSGARPAGAVARIDLRDGNLYVKTVAGAQPDKKAYEYDGEIQSYEPGNLLTIRRRPRVEVKYDLTKKDTVYSIAPGLGADRKVHVVESEENGTHHVTVTPQEKDHS
jgi:LSD1 subclass zinc finger protein